MNIAMPHKSSDYVIYFIMWKKITSVTIVLLFIAILLHPSIIAEGASDGLKLWLEAVIPALLPFMIISNIIIMSGIAGDMNFIMFPLAVLLRISPDASYCIISGLLFGYPSCAVSACSMYSRGMLDRATAEYCICCFNNISPAFVAGYFCTSIIHNPKITGAVLGIFYSVTLISAVILRYTVFGKLITQSQATAVMPKKSGKLPDSAIMSSLINIGKIGGYIIIFSIICKALSSIGFPAPFGQIICSVTEITTGLKNLGNLGLPASKLLMLGIPLLHFGGLCGMFQTFGVDTMSIISKKKYIFSKTVTLILSGLITYLAVYVLKITG